MIIIMNYIKRGKRAKKIALDNLDYIATRVNKEKKKVDRQLFGPHGPGTKDIAERVIKRAPPNTLFWRMKLSPDPNAEVEDKEQDLDLWKLTAKAVQWLEDRLDREIPFIGVEHDDHSDVRHTHALLLIQRQGREKLITPEVLADFREAVAGFAGKQMEQPGKALTLEALQRAQDGLGVPPRGQEPTAPKMPQQTALATPSYGMKGGAVRRQRDERPTCPNCGIALLMQKFKDGRVRCANCGLVLTSGLQKEKEVEWSR